MYFVYWVLGFLNNMILPSVKKELELIKKGQVVVGVDEVGRGPLAGPVVAVAAWVDERYLEEDFKLKKWFRDSKTLAEKKRNEIFEFIEKTKGFEIGVGEVTPKTIDRINILNASLLAMRLAVENLVPKIKNFENEIILVDGNKIIPGINYYQEAIIKGDQQVFSIAVASIYAKVFRDRKMIKYSDEFPEYGFKNHKGYGTKKHLEALNNHGICEIHRKSFGPVKILVN